MDDPSGHYTSEVSQAQKDKSLASHFLEAAKAGDNFTETEGRVVVARACGGRGVPMRSVPGFRLGL